MGCATYRAKKVCVVFVRFSLRRFSGSEEMAGRLFARGVRVGVKSFVCGWCRGACLKLELNYSSEISKSGDAWDWESDLLRLRSSGTQIAVLDHEVSELEVRFKTCVSDLRSPDLEAQFNSTEQCTPHQPQLLQRFRQFHAN
jgi:hypothetical protein